MIGGLILDSEMTHNLYTVDANVHLLEKKYMSIDCVLSLATMPYSAFISVI
jgi:hypothetical protein